MGIHSILVSLESARHARARVAAAAALALAHDAHLVGLATIAWLPAPADIAGAYGLAAYQAAALQELEQQARACASDFSAQMQQLGVPSHEARVEAGFPADAMVLAARHADLTIVSRPDADEAFKAQSQAIAQDLLMQSGRPLLVLPAGGDADAAWQLTPPRRVLVGWNGSREAARALHDALPLLQQASDVEVAVFAAPGEPDLRQGDLPGADIGLWLARHGVRVDVRHVPTRVAAGEALLLHATDTAADLIVAGGYGHARLREAVLGGVTRTLLQASPLPVLLSH